MRSTACVRVTLFSPRGLEGSRSPRGAAAFEEKSLRGFSPDRAEQFSRKPAETDATTRANATRDVGLNTGPHHMNFPVAGRVALGPRTAPTQVGPCQND